MVLRSLNWVLLLVSSSTIINLSSSMNMETWRRLFLLLSSWELITDMQWRVLNIWGFLSDPASTGIVIGDGSWIDIGFGLGNGLTDGYPLGAGSLWSRLFLRSFWYTWLTFSFCLNRSSTRSTASPRTSYGGATNLITNIIW